ncbi:MAG: hypothetical protein GY749_14055 [Desulfobacteraceae bacterium]|nr:hypothetical protein [Desulfobacteraceae bacterium]MCP4353385.1 hypothetical protein [Desulfobacterales bacterium]
MTNYEKLFQDQMKDQQFAKFYAEARVDRMMNEVLDDLKKKISENEPREVLLETIESIQRQFA